MVRRRGVWTAPTSGFTDGPAQSIVKFNRIRVTFANLPVLRRKGEPEMTELEILTRNVHGLKELLRVAWRDLANPLLTLFERREARNQINQYSAELRRHLQLIEAERSRSRKQPSPQKSHRVGEAKLRVLA
jgi:hypothetical protein